MALPATQAERLAALRSAITSANYRAVRPRCCHRDMALDAQSSGEDGDSFDFVCDICDKKTYVELPVRLAHATRLLCGAA